MYISYVCTKNTNLLLTTLKEHRSLKRPLVQHLIKLSLERQKAGNCQTHIHLFPHIKIFTKIPQLRQNHSLMLSLRLGVVITVAYGQIPLAFLLLRSWFRLGLGENSTATATATATATNTATALRTLLQPLKVDEESFNPEFAQLSAEDT